MITDYFLKKFQCMHWWPKTILDVFSNALSIRVDPALKPKNHQDKEIEEKDHLSSHKT